MYDDFYHVTQVELSWGKCLAYVMGSTKSGGVFLGIKDDTKNLVYKYFKFRFLKKGLGRKSFEKMHHDFFQVGSANSVKLRGY